MSDRRAISAEAYRWLCELWHEYAEMSADQRDEVLRRVESAMQSEDPTTVYLGQVLAATIAGWMVEQAR